MTQRVFVTGTTGYIGSAIAARLVRAGRDVRGLARGQERASALEALGVRAVLGELATPDTYLSEMKNCDAVVHVALDEAQAAGVQFSVQRSGSGSASLRIGPSLAGPMVDG